jgi:hypothetical protein
MENFTVIHTNKLFTKMQTLRLTLVIFISLLVQNFSLAQSKANDIPVSQLPENVRQVLVEYVNILRTSANLEECAKKFTAIAGGGLVNEDAQNITLRANVQPFSLKKDFENSKFYANPIKITRVNVSKTNGNGFGASAVAGTLYKIWIDKANPANGMPAPVTIIVPENHPHITSPKVVNIGSF